MCSKIGPDVHFAISSWDQLGLLDHKLADCAILGAMQDSHADQKHRVGGARSRPSWPSDRSSAMQRNLKSDKQAESSHTVLAGAVEPCASWLLHLQQAAHAQDSHCIATIDVARMR